MDKKHLLIGLGVAAAAVGVYVIAKNSSSSNSGSTTLTDLTPPTITLGSYPAQSPQGQPPVSTAPAPQGQPPVSTAPATGSPTTSPTIPPRKGYPHGTTSPLSAFSITPFPIVTTPFPVIDPNPVRRPLISPIFKSGAAFDQQILDPQSVSIAPSVVH